MKTLTRVGLVILVTLCLAIPGGAVQGQRNAAAPTGYITGVVRSSPGPEAGVWVIAETKDLLTNFIKIVVTDDQGRFMLPDLPSANYSVWVRGYGLVDSAKTQMKPSTNSVTLPATVAGAIRAVARLRPPAAKVFFGGHAALAGGLDLQDFHLVARSGCNMETGIARHGVNRSGFL